MIRYIRKVYLTHWQGASFGEALGRKAFPGSSLTFAPRACAFRSFLARAAASANTRLRFEQKPLEWISNWKHFDAQLRRVFPSVCAMFFCVGFAVVNIKQHKIFHQHMRLQTSWDRGGLLFTKSQNKEYNTRNMLLVQFWLFTPCTGRKNRFLSN